MRVRVLLEPRHGGSYDQFLAFARAAEEAGFDAFFRSDHLLGVDPADTTYATTDAWTTLAGLARDTARIRLGTLVTPGTFRWPGFLAVSAANTDVMSGGRVELGLGAGWYEREHRAFGVPFPPMKERFDRLEEQMAIIKGLWTIPPGEGFSFSGRHYRLEDCVNAPRTAQSPHPPIVVGGAGPRRTPALAARFADEYNATFGTGARERFAVFHRACEEIGRDPATARLSVALPVACGADQAEVDRRQAVMGSPRMLAEAACGAPETVLDRLSSLAADGVDTVYFHIYDIDDLDHIRLLGEEVVPKASRLSPAPISS
ncbi:MAG: TIGR03560 family F420-dependent LLM class oxidoreductase [Streptosporangiales bacterium]|nr:TIGR03560 family F420-dependent LLM class oxidoreductase [Streptosporangiales bacterium]